jgi:branched-chain amino acid transport system permease protein
VSESPADREALAYARWQARMASALRPLITDELIEEHRRKPLGQHSDTLERVLNYVRRAPPADKYIGICTRPWAEWRIGVLSGIRGVPPTILEDERFTSAEALEHGIFLRRVRDLTAS